MSIEFVPNCAQGEAKSFEGKAVFKPMSLDQRYEMADELQKISAEKGNLRALIKGFDYVEPVLISCEFKNLELNLEYNSFKDLRADSRNDELCQELVGFVMQGYRVSKNLNA